LTLATAPPSLDRLRAVLGQVADLRHVEQLLDWDQHVSMPHAGAAARAEALGTVTQLAHELLVSDPVGELLEELVPLERELGHDSPDGALIRVARRDWDRAQRVPPELTGELSRSSGIAVAAWEEAKSSSDFGIFAPHLERQLELKRRYAACFPDVATPYDALLDEFEEGMTTERVAEIFGELRPALVSLVAEVRDRQVDPAALRGPFPIATQKEACSRILGAFGVPEGSWRLDETVHPFASAPGLGDVRLTTNFRAADLNALFSTMHEFGHGVYEFSVDSGFRRSPLGSGASSAVHESQSRTWENLVGRSRGFWRWFYPTLRSLFADSLAGVDEEAFYGALNAVHPGLIRIEADEVTYGLHVILRFELEQELLTGNVAVRDLPEAWNARVEEFLGLEVPDDANGVLQDIHWALGLLGYFPSYQLGNVISVQIWRCAEAALGDLGEQFARGEFASVRNWLGEHVYRHGRMYPPRELVRRVTGSDLDAGPYLEYLRTKFSAA
jgi:carboxypeptidase Taq